MDKNFYQNYSFDALLLLNEDVKATLHFIIIIFHLFIYVYLWHFLAFNIFKEDWQHSSGIAYRPFRTSYISVEFD